MFKRDAMPSSHAETIIAVGVRVEGDFTSKGDVVIDGEVNGSVHTDESLRIGETARIQADVSAGSAIIAGEIQGNLRIADRLELLETSRINGDIDVRVLSMAPGATVNGRISMEGGNGKAPRPIQGEGE